MVSNNDYILDDHDDEDGTEIGNACAGPVEAFTSPDRRGLIKMGLGGALGMMFANWLSPALAQGAAKPIGKRPKSCILLWMNGGPSHLDTWDPKPGAVNGGPFRAIKTRAGDVQICEHLPQVADVADKIAIVRGMTTKEGNHQRAQYLMHTGYTPNPTVTHPSLGAWVNEELADPNYDLPGFVSISGPSYGAGFLGVQYGPFVIQKPGQMPQNVSYASRVNDSRFDQRQQALQILESDFAKRTADIKVTGREAVYSHAVKMMHSPRLKAFDLTEESDAVKAAYGDSDFGRGCLTARRLVESGVRFVEVVLDGWDTHQDNFNRVKKQMTTFDPAMAMLIKDLGERHLLDDTLIVWMGEFGRTPKINANEGRDHFPGAWSAVLAGGGVRGGQAYGATSEDGTKVVDRPTPVCDLFATIAAVLGMDLTKTFMTPIGRPINITEKGTPIKDLIA